MKPSLEQLRILCTAAETQNFREAAGRLGISPQVITRTIHTLEQTTGETLFHRNTRGVRLSEFGEKFVLRAREALAAVDALFDSTPNAADPQYTGRVRVAAPVALGRGALIEALAPCMADHPGLVIELRLSDRLSDVVEQQIDVGVRNGFMRDSNFVAQPAAKTAFRIVASSALIARAGRPRKVDDIFKYPITALIDHNTGRPWPWTFSQGRQITPDSPVFITDSIEAECAAAIAGAGFSQLPEYMVKQHLKSGALVSVLDKEAPEPWNLYVYRPRRQPVPARIRLVYDALLKAFKSLG